MGRPSKAVPSYLKAKNGGARVRINGREYTLGKYGSPESRALYLTLIQKHRDAAPIVVRRSGVSVAELVLAFLDHAEMSVSYSQQCVLRSACLPLVEVHGETPINDFGPIALKQVRQKMIANGWARATINSAVSRVRQVFRFGVENEMVPSAIWDALKAVTPLLRGKTSAPDFDKRKPVSESDFQRVRAEVSDLMGDVLDMLRLTGARCGEIVGLTGRMIDRSGAVWTASLERHKTASRGKSRVLVFGPKAQAILERRWTMGRLFDVRRDAVALAVRRVCQRLKMTPWVPHQLRHTAGTVARELFGLDHAQALLGHSSADMTEHYAAVALQKASEVAARLG